MTDELSRSETSGRDPNIEYHDGDETAICVGQWCCGCAEHPVGKPWGWNHEAWAAHFRATENARAARSREAATDA